MKKISLVALYYQGKDEELMQILREVETHSESTRKESPYQIDPNECDRFGKSMLNVAISNRDEDLSLLLMRVGADFLKADNTGEYPLFNAIKNLFTNVACVMIAQMVPDTDCDYWFNKVRAPYNHRPIIFEAIFDPKILEAILSAGGDPLAVDDCLETPLELATVFNEEESVRLLLQHLPKGVGKHMLPLIKKQAVLNPKIANMIQAAIDRL